MTTTIKKFRPVEKNGKVHSVTYNTIQEAIKAAGGVSNIKDIKEVNEIVKVSKVNKVKMPKVKKAVSKELVFDECDRCYVTYPISNMDSDIENYAYAIAQSISKKEKLSEPGSLPYALFGSIPSTASLYIKLGRNFEKWFKYVVTKTDGFDLLSDGLTNGIVDGKKKDVDFIFKNESTKTIYYRELKSNTELDTEKLPATIEKIKKISTYLNDIHPDYNVECGLLTWSVYSRDMLPTNDARLKAFNDAGINVTFPSDLFTTLGQSICKEDYSNMLRNIGSICKK
jgi:hypothetical protein